MIPGVILPSYEHMIVKGDKNPELNTRKRNTKTKAN